MLCRQNTKTSRWKVRSAVSHSDFCSAQQQTGSHLQSSERLAMFSDIVNLCCFFHLIQFSDYPPTSDIISSASRGREGGREYSVWALCGHFWIPFFFWSTQQEKKMTRVCASQRFCHAAFNFYLEIGGARWLKRIPLANLWLSIVYSVLLTHLWKSLHNILFFLFSHWPLKRVNPMSGKLWLFSY